VRSDRQSLPIWTISILAGIALALAVSIPATAQADFSDYGLESVEASLSSNEAGAHPNFNLEVAVKTDPSTPPNAGGLHEPYARTRDLVIQLPPGLVGNPNAVSKCTVQQFVSFTLNGDGCPQDSQVGVAVLTLFSFSKPLTEPIFNMETPSNDTVARLGFYAGTIPNFVSVKVRSESDYGLTATTEGVPANERLVKADIEIWGVPADPSHDRLRLTPREAFPEGKSESPSRKSGLAPAPFMTNPVSCEGALPVVVSADSYQTPGQFSTLTDSLPGMSGCGNVEFDPRLIVTPTSREAAAPTGLAADLTIPQNESPYGIATGQLRAATVTLPEGMTIASGAAAGLQACSATQVGVAQDVDAACPAASKIGSAEFDVPALSRRLHGEIYQRTPEPGNLFRIWLVTDELGLHVKIPGEIQVNRRTGQVTSVFVDTPRVPLRELQLDFKSGAQGVLANPPACGTYQTRYAFTPWSSELPLMGNAPMTIDQGCATGGFSPSLSAGTVSPSAGAFSSFTLDLKREGDEQNIAGLDVRMPPGLLAKLAGVPLCAEALAVTGGCGAASQIGVTSVAVGPGPSPLWIPQPGKAPTAVYLSGPYGEAPYSLVVKTPAQAGPFDLGTVVVRAGIFIDPSTAQVTVKSDPLPQILEGVPISYRDIHVAVNRPEFALNPTSCDAMSIDARVTSIVGAVARPSSRFQIGNCARLGFKPKLTTSLKGSTKRNGYPRLRAVFRPRPGDANAARVTVALPRSEFLAQNHIRTVCTRVQFAADGCPPGSIYGKARAFSPLLDRPLEGPVYLRSSSNPLPDLVVALRGQVSLDLVGRIDSVNGGIRTTFAHVPDAPVRKFVLTMKGGKKGLLVNSRNLCASPSFSVVRMDGQNGKTADSKPRLQAQCGKRK
jgi:hypothetical protein